MIVYVKYKKGYIPRFTYNVVASGHYQIHKGLAMHVTKYVFYNVWIATVHAIGCILMDVNRLTQCHKMA